MNDFEVVLLIGMVFLDTGMTYYISSKMKDFGLEPEDYELNPLPKLLIKSGMTWMKYLLWIGMYLFLVIYGIYASQSERFVSFLFGVLLILNYQHLLTVITLKQKKKNI